MRQKHRIFSCCVRKQLLRQNQTRRTFCLIFLVERKQKHKKEEVMKNLFTKTLLVENLQIEIKKMATLPAGFIQQCKCHRQGAVCYWISLFMCSVVVDSVPIKHTISILQPKTVRQSVDVGEMITPAYIGVKNTEQYRGLT